MQPLNNGTNDVAPFQHFKEKMPKKKSTKRTEAATKAAAERRGITA